MFTMNKRVAIHNRPLSFSDRWIERCKDRNIPFKIVDCHASDIVQQLAGCSALMWHYSQTYVEDMLIADAVIKSAEAMGLKVFPSHATAWHFDDKVAQKYLMEALGIPSVTSYVFVSKRQALDWAYNTDYPKVFKLRTGAGSSNVQLVKNRESAVRLIGQAFSTGFAPVPRWHSLRERWWHLKRDHSLRAFLDVSRGMFRGIIPNPILKRLPIQKNYVYFQDFIPGIDFDIRVIAIGSRAFGIKRMVRAGDFRASGSGKIIYDPSAVPSACVSMTFKAAEAVRSQSLALDFVFDGSTPLVVEMSYAFVSNGYWDCPGIWKPDLSWTPGRFRAEDFMLDDLLASLEGAVSFIS